MDTVKLQARIKELEQEVEDYKCGRRYSRDPNRPITSRAPIDMLADQTNDIAKALGITEDEWRRGWNIVTEIGRLRSGERK